MDNGAGRGEGLRLDLFHFIFKNDIKYIWEVMLARKRKRNSLKMTHTPIRSRKKKILTLTGFPYLWRYNDKLLTERRSV